MAKKGTALTKAGSNGGAVLDLEAYKKNQKVLAKFIKEYLTEGKDGEGDYGTIKGCGDRKVLFKSGAEKLAEFYQYGTRMTCEKETEDFGKEKVGSLFFAYTYKCIVFPLGDPENTVGDCEASANSRERKFVGAPNNTVRKMAQKRAYVGAVIMSTRSSQWFTQDMEDRAPDGGENVQQSAKPEGRKGKERRFHILAGEVGEMKPVTEAYLLKTYGNKSATKLTDAELDSEIARLANVRDIVGIFKGQGNMPEKIRSDLQKKYDFTSWFELPADKIGQILKKARAATGVGNDR
jgi:hypothetical protein